MIACVDVHYHESAAVAVAVEFENWADAQPLHEVSVDLTVVEPYRPGEFYRRELPCLVTALSALPQRPQVVIVDGYVWLDDDRTPGLGAHLFDALAREVAIIGGVKSSFRGAKFAQNVFRGRSRSPLHVTAVGVEENKAAGHIKSMHGEFRIPTLLKRADQLSRRQV
jgi:deoxyribonuclease V